MFTPLEIFKKRPIRYSVCIAGLVLVVFLATTYIFPILSYRLQFPTVEAIGVVDHDLIDEVMKPQIGAVVSDDGENVSLKLSKKRLTIKKDFSHVIYDGKDIGIEGKNVAGLQYVPYTGTGISSDVRFASSDNKRSIVLTVYDDILVVRATGVSLQSLTLPDTYIDTESAKWYMGSIDLVTTESGSTTDKKQFTPSLELSSIVSDGVRDRLSTDQDMRVARYFQSKDNPSEFLGYSVTDKKFSLGQTTFTIPSGKTQEITLVHNFSRSIGTESYISLDTFQGDPYAVDEIYKMGGFSFVKENSFFYADTPQIGYLDTELGKYIEIRLTSEQDAQYIARRDNTVYYQGREDIYAYTLGTGKNREKIKDSVIIQTPREKNQYTYEVRGNYRLNPNDDGSVGVFTQNLNKASLSETCSDEYYTREHSTRESDVKLLSSGALEKKYGRVDVDTENFCVSPSIIKEKKKQIAYDVDVFRIERPIILDRDDQLIDLPISVVAGSGNTLSYSFDTSDIDEDQFPIRFDPTLTTDVGLKAADIDNITIPGGAGLGTPDVGDGSLGAWSTGSMMGTARYNHKVTNYNGYIYAIGGTNGSNLQSTEYAPINANGTLGNWTPTQSMGTARTNYGLVVYNGYIYALGGYDGAFNTVSSTEYAPINANGTLGNWTPTQSMGTARMGLGVIVYNGYIYSIGGVNSAGTTLNTVEYAPINANGMIGLWNGTALMGTVRYGHGVATYNGYIYVLGGNNGSNLQSTEYAPINANGTLGNWTPTQSMGTVRNRHGVTIYNGYIYAIGGTNGSNLQSTEYAPINANGTLGNWTPTSTMLVARVGIGVTVYNGYVYAIGGTNGPTLNTTEYARINRSGGMGTWNPSSTMLAQRMQHGVATYNGYIYAIGGTSNGSTTLNTTEYAPINSDGSIGSWNTGSTLTIPRRTHGVAVYNGYIYAIGGLDTVSYSSTEYAQINANGSIGTWNSTQSLGIVRQSPGVAVYNGYIYAIGGWNGSGLAYRTTEYVAVNSDGSLAPWVTSPSLMLANRESPGIALYRGYIYVIGGYNGSAYVNTTEYVAVNSDGTLGTWLAGTSMGTARSDHGIALFNGYIYVVGGYNGVRLNTTEYAPILANGNIGGWTNGPNMGSVRSDHAVTLYNGYLYAIGGYNGTSRLNSTEYTAILGFTSNAGLGNWTAGTNNMTTARAFHGAIVYNGYIYAIGGQNGGALNTVEYALINSNGTIGVWSATQPMLTARYGHGFVAHNGYIYSLGGYNGSTLNSTEYASMSATGVLGVWSATQPMLTARYGHRSVIYNGYIYVVGGVLSNSNTTEYAPLNTNGSIGTWTPGTTMGALREGAGVVVYNGYIYAIGGGGNNGVNPLNSTEYAPLNPNGSIGTWTPGTNMGIPRYSPGVAIYNGYVYAIGGKNGSDINTTEYAPINSDGTIGNWTSSSNMITVRGGVRVAFYNGYVYAIGGTNGSALNTTEYAKIGIPIIQSWHKLYDRGSASTSPIYVSLGYASRVDPDTQIRYTLWDSTGSGRLYKGSWVPLSSYVVPGTENKVTLNTYGQNFRYLEFEIMRPTSRDKIDNNIVSIGYGELSCLVCGGGTAVINGLCVITTSMSCSATDIDVQNGGILDVRSPAAIDFDFITRKVWVRNGGQILVRDGASLR